MSERGGRRPGSGIGGGAYAATDYESDSTCSEYLAFHYPAEDALTALLGDGAPPQPERYPFGVRAFWEAVPAGVALDVGAAGGRVTADLARDHRYAVGLDFSKALMRAAAGVQARCAARYTVVVEGDLRERVEVPVDPFPNAAFCVGDALDLPFAERLFDTVVGLNLIDRVPDPGHALNELVRVTRPGGLLILSSPYTWVDGFTPKDSWLGGFERGERPVRASDEIRERLGATFVLQREARMPFFIRHHERSGQLAVTHVQSFRRKT